MVRHSRCEVYFLVFHVYFAHYVIYIVGAAEVPDAMEIIFQKALEVGTSGAVSKLPFMLPSFFPFISAILFGDELSFD